jgi:PAS domain S-box-containing protein
MTTKARSSEELLSEIETLRFRLEEAEEILRAVGNGEVDAFVVSGPDGDQVFTLKGAEQPYRVLVETMNEGAVTLDAEGIIVYCNNSFASLLKVDPVRLTGTCLVRYLAQADQPLFKARLENCTGGSVKVEMCLVDSAENRVPVLISCCALQVAGSRSVSLIVTDLTQQRRNEEIMAAEWLARSVIDQAGEAIVVCDDQGMVIRANRLALELCGANPLLKAFDDVFELTIPETERCFSVATLLEGACCESLEVKFRRDDGQACFLILNATPLRGNQGPVFGCVVTLTDITPRRQMEEALRDSRDRLALTLEAGHMGIWEWDFGNNSSVWNDTEYQLLGLPVGGGTESTQLFFDRVHPEDLGPFRELLAEVLRSGSEFQHELRILRAADAQECWLAAVGRLFRDADGAPVRMLGVNYDISLQKGAEARLKKGSEELERRVNERTRELSENMGA